MARTQLLNCVYMKKRSQLYFYTEKSLVAKLKRLNPGVKNKRAFTNENVVLKLCFGFNTVCFGLNKVCFGFLDSLGML